MENGGDDAGEVAVLGVLMVGMRSGEDDAEKVKLDIATIL